MNLTKYIPKSATRTVARQVLTLKKNSPHIAFGVGIVGVIGGTVLACRATLKVSETLDEIKNDVEGIQNPPATLIKKPTEQEMNRDLAYAYGKGTFKVIKLYAPAVIVTGVSIAALTGSHVTLARRNTALTIAYAGLQQAYEDYRGRVREEYGEAKELDIYHAAEIEKVKEGGKTKELRVVNPNGMSPYARFFDEYSKNWEKDPELNRLFVQCQQTYLNNLLQVRGHVFLNEAYDSLGIPRSTPGQIVGWVLSDDGDNFIDFGIFEARNAAFVNGEERSILLDFNVDGVIYDKI